MVCDGGSLNDEAGKGPLFVVSLATEPSRLDWLESWLDFTDLVDDYWLSLGAATAEVCLGLLD